MKKIILLAGVLMAVTSVAQADETSDLGLFIEPSITWEKGSADIDLPSPLGKSSSDVDGFGLGARVGFHVMDSLFIGVDGRYSFPTFKEDKLGMDTDAKSWNAGPVVGLQMPTTLGLRVWGSYIAAGELDPDRDNSVDVKFKSGQGFRVGAGVKLGVVSLNAEYQKLKYDKTEVQSVGIFDPGSESHKTTLDNESVILSASFPIAI